MSNFLASVTVYNNTNQRMFPTGEGGAFPVWFNILPLTQTDLEYFDPNGVDDRFGFIGIKKPGRYLLTFNLTIQIMSLYMQPLIIEFYNTRSSEHISPLRVENLHLPQVVEYSTTIDIVEEAYLNLNLIISNQMEITMSPVSYFRILSLNYDIEPKRIDLKKILRGKSSREMIELMERGEIKKFKIYLNVNGKSLKMYYDGERIVYLKNKSVCLILVEDGKIYLFNPRKERVEYEGYLKYC